MDRGRAPPAPTFPTLDAWIRAEAIPFARESTAGFNAAIDTVIASLGDEVELLGLGEGLHGGEEILLLRNRPFQRLVEAHGYCAIALESSFPRARVVDEYVAGRGVATYEEIQDSGFGYGFGRLDAIRALVEWMRRYNADPSHPDKLRFYAFDMPVGTNGTVGPRQVPHAALDYLAAHDPNSDRERRDRIERLIGPDARWEFPVD
jgi:erythromycin esterase-like protein